MRPVCRCLALLALLLALPLAARAGDARVIVQYRAGAAILDQRGDALHGPAAARAAVLAQRTGLPLAAGRPVSNRSHVVFAHGMASEALAARLAQEGDVEFAVPDRRKRIATAPNDPLYAPDPVPANGPASGQWYLKAPGDLLRSAIGVEGAWSLTTAARRAGVVVAVLDTGIRKDHRDLAANLLPGYDMITDPDIANDGNARDGDPSDQGDWLDQADINSGKFAPDCSAADIAPSSWHGTETTGLIAALTDNGIGMASVGREVKIVPVRVLGKCGGWDSDIQAGMRWAAGVHVDGVPDNPNPARVLNLSLGGGTGCSMGYQSAVADAAGQGAVIVAAAGNGYGGQVAEPGACSGVIAVGGVTHLGTKADFSNLGTGVALSAPGGDCGNLAGECLYPILTTSNSGTTTPVSDAAGGSIYSDARNRPSLGTSFSAPLVSGTVALMLAVEPSLTPSRVRALLRASARPFPAAGALSGTPECHAPDGSEQDECACTTATCGAGLLDARAAVAAAADPASLNGNGGGGSGGGALGPAWLLLLALALVALRRVPG